MENAERGKVYVARHVPLHEKLSSVGGFLRHMPIRIRVQLNKKPSGRSESIMRQKEGYFEARYECVKTEHMNYSQEGSVRMRLITRLISSVS